MSCLPRTIVLRFPSMPRQTEPNANNALGILLQGMMHGSTVRSEHTQAILGHPGLRPDILITASGRSPVEIEAEYIPAASVEDDATVRLGLEIESDGRVIEAAIALRYPTYISEVDDLHASCRFLALTIALWLPGIGHAIERALTKDWATGLSLRSTGFSPPSSKHRKEFA